MSWFAALTHKGLALSTAAVAAVTSGALLVASSVGTPTATPAPSGDAAISGVESGATNGDVPGAVTPVAGPDPVDVVVTDVITGTAPEQVEGADRDVARFRQVAVNTAALPTNSVEAQRELALPLFDDTTVVADLDAPTYRQAGGYRTWSGSIVDDAGSTVVFVEQGGVLSGYVSGSDATYRLRPLPDGSTQVEQIDESRFPAGHPHPAPPAISADEAAGTGEHTHAPGTPAHSHDAPADPAGDLSGSTSDAGDATGDGPQLAAATPDAPVIDVLVGYTPGARTRMGGQAGMDADIALMIEQTNTAFATSGINALVRLAGTAEVPSNGLTDSADHIGLLRTTNDGYYDQLHVLRDQVGADLISLIIDAPTAPYCGVAYIPNGIGTQYAGLGVSVNDARCATGNTTFTHELGHNFGAAHDRGSWAGTPVLPYGYDWVNQSQGWRTVMSYTNACSGCARLLRFSNPDQTYNGAPVGAPAGAANAADNRALINTTASTIAGYRGAPVAPSLSVTSPTAGQQVVASDKLVATWSTTGYLGSDAKVELMRGTTVVKLLTAKVPLGAGRYEYVVPLTTVRADDYTLRVTPLVATQFAATGDAFSVVDPAITPSFTGTATQAGTARVTWTYTGAPGGTVKVELLKDGKLLAALKTGAVLGTGGAGAVDVVLPAALNNGSGYQFRTTLSALPKAPALTGDFSVSSTRQLVVTAPGSGGTHTAGTPLAVTWTASGVLGTSVKAELVKGDVVVFTSASAPSTAGTLSFTPPAKLPTGTDYRVRLTAVSYPTVIATSGGSFSIDGSSVTVTSQSTAGSVTAGRPLTITFTKTGLPGTAVKLEAVSPNLTPVTIAASVPIGAGTYTWTVPASLPKADWKVRATVVGNTLVTSTSAAATTVTWPTISVSSSAAGVAGAPVTVSWAYTDGAAAPVKVRLLQGTKVVATVTSTGATAADGTGSVSYRLPVNLVAGNYQFDVAAAANATIVARTGDVPVTLPTLAASGATSVVRGQTATIAWSFSAGASAPVRIDLVQGTKVIAVKSGAVTAVDGTGSFAYKAPTTLPAGTYTLRIRPAVLATSAAIQATRTFTVS